MCIRDRDTAVASFAGIVEVTVGMVVSGAAPVVKVQRYLATNELAGSSWSCAPVVIVAVNVVLGARFSVGVKVATEPAAT